MASAEGKRTERFSEKSLNLENSLKFEVRLRSRDTSGTKVTNGQLREYRDFFSQSSLEMEDLKKRAIVLSYESTCACVCVCVFVR